MKRSRLLSSRVFWPRSAPGYAIRCVTRFVTVTLAVGLIWGMWAVPFLPPVQAQSGITSPASGESVSGAVPIMGTAVIDPFQKYELHYKMEPSGDDAYIYFDGGTTPVQNGQLGVWQAGGLPAGVYSLRLRVVRNDGNYAEFFAQNLSVNQTPPTPSPTPTSSEPTPTPIPTATFTPAPQPTPVVGTVAQPALEGDAPPTPTDSAPAAAVVDSGQPPAADTEGGDTGAAVTTETIAAAGADLSSLDTAANTSGVAESGSVTRELGEALSLNRLRTHFLNGMRFSAAMFLGVVALYGGKRLFDWVWSQLG